MFKIVNSDGDVGLFEDILDESPDSRPTEAIQTTSDPGHVDVGHLVLLCMILHLLQTLSQGIIGRFTTIHLLSHQVVDESLFIIQDCNVFNPSSTVLQFINPPKLVSEQLCNPLAESKVSTDTVTQGMAGRGAEQISRNFIQDKVAYRVFLIIICCILINISVNIHFVVYYFFFDFLQIVIMKTKLSTIASLPWMETLFSYPKISFSYLEIYSLPHLHQFQS